MRYVIIRDDDTNATTPPWCLEKLYRPFMDRKLPVNLAVIPEVCTNTRSSKGSYEGFIFGSTAGEKSHVPVGHAQELTQYIQSNPEFHVVQHGLTHESSVESYEFDLEDRDDVVYRLQRGARLLEDAGFPPPQTFVAPHDKLSATALQEVASRYRVLSSGWYEFRRLPLSWRPKYLLNKATGRSHWRTGNTLLLTHPGCLLSHDRPHDTMLKSVTESIGERTLTVLVTHWWEYFPEGQPDDEFIDIFHQTADYLFENSEIAVLSFSDLAKLPKNCLK